MTEGRGGRWEIASRKRVRKAGITLNVRVATDDIFIELTMSVVDILRNQPSNSK